MSAPAFALVALTWCPFSQCAENQPSRTNEVVHSFDFESLAWAPQPATTPPVRLYCGWLDREAAVFAKWRDFRLHATHENATEALCESHQVWQTFLMGGNGDPSGGVYLNSGTMGGLRGHVYYDGSARACTLGTPRQLKCDESGTARASRCEESTRWAFHADPATMTITCLSSDPKACR